MNDAAIESLLLPVGEASPTGPDLEYDADFMALERAATAKAERAIGDEVKAAEEPDWDRVRSLAESLLARSKDLRVSVHLATAWMRTAGLPGYASGLGLIRGLLENYWEGVHPQLDAEDDNDPTARVNAVVPLGDAMSVLGYFRTTAFVQSPRIGRFSLRDLRIANGTLKIAGNENGEGLPSLTDIEACCLDCAEDQLLASAAAASQVLEQAKAIDAIYSEQVGTAGPDLKALLSDSYELKKFLDAQVARRAPQDDTTEAAAEGDDPVPASPGAGVAAASGRIQNADDVRRRLDDLCDYYARTEPSSPIPLLLRRAQRLVGKTFVDLMQDLAPGGISELRVIAGPDENE
ncbi:type VI secretion system protein TssA [Dyella sp.]|jgi:type VI secretion system protein ImpA|uniref:type VI secretion system protein TssA n=1 Tax=Dyella sp. TaxID=1869338 RepID=UPI002D78E0BB|nr:type VI secretion system protein TssA [Dyella sp.]HET6433627.1 type VI secretion system protein TssA [Dyella sp.]